MSVDVNALQKAQDAGLTVGVVPKSGQTVVRLEIDDLLERKELANLYFLALESFMSEAIHENAFSYYEISGIHGQPARAWDNVTSAGFDKPGDKEHWPGYCAHGSVLFPLWHRAYLAQFEQALFLHAAKIADSLGDEAKAALEEFRIPYWDPLLPRQKQADAEEYKYGIPIIFTLPEIMVRRPESPKIWKAAKNPLYQLKFPPDSKEPGIDWSGFKRVNMPDVPDAVKRNTIRGYDGSTPNPDHVFVMKTFDDDYNPSSTLGNSVASRIYHVMFDQNQDWMMMSNHYLPTDRKDRLRNANSLEGFHDDIHNALGAGKRSREVNSQNQALWPSGHMSNPSYAGGFDPVFWLHHCNIDRLLAIWQGINSQKPESYSWWQSELNFLGTFVEPPKVDETPSTPLAPFRREFDSQSNVVWWKSTDARDHTKLGYDYQQIVDARNTGNLVSGLIKWANAELGWADPEHFKKQGGDPEAMEKLKAQVTAHVQAFPEEILIDGTTPLDPNEEYISSRSIKVQPQSRIVPKAPAKTTDQADYPRAQQILKSSIPTQEVSFEDRFGGLKGLVSNGRMTQWNATFGVEKYALDGSFVVHFFIGDFSPISSNWLHDPHRAGSSGIFATSRSVMHSGGCENCAKQATQGLKYYDTVALTQALLTYWRSGEEVNGLRVTSLEPNVVVPFLTRNLHWRVLSHFGEHINRENIPSLRVGIYSETVVLPQQLSDVPLFENQTMQYGITNGRPGGLNDDEEL